MLPKCFLLLTTAALLSERSSVQGGFVVAFSTQSNKSTKNRAQQWTTTATTPRSLVVRHSQPPRNGKTQPPNVQNDRDTFVLDLQSEIASLYESISRQKTNYDVTMGKLQKDANQRVEEAQEQVDAVKKEYEAYKTEIWQKLAKSASPEEVARLESQVGSLNERTNKFKRMLDEALAKLSQNRKDRMSLQGEMVALKESYIDKLNDLEDQLEFAQDESVRAQQDAMKQVTEIQAESKKKLNEAIEAGRKQVDELTLEYTKRIGLKDQEIETAKNALSQARRAVREKEEVIDRLEAENRSVRKLLGKTLSLAKGRIAKRVRWLIPGKGRRGKDEEIESEEPVGTEEA